VNRKLIFQPEAEETLSHLSKVDQRKYKRVVKALGYMEVNLRHPSLQTHKYSDYNGPNGEHVFESYVENMTPGAYRIFWFYGPGTGRITVLAITPHP
jgi:hypothetical protein